MLFCQLGHAKPSREICVGPAASEKHFVTWVCLRPRPAPPLATPMDNSLASYTRVFDQPVEKCQGLEASQGVVKKRKKMSGSTPNTCLTSSTVMSRPSEEFRSILTSC
jgi:hypothetical protein